ncbi:hypothetical protein [Luteimonas notoginsengisoli]|uniref:Uncharacterized protein n=1 Tax=Luteimonas notoginsengisoli TaxID=1578200 RepID=A0ABV7URY1_9GAMM
MAHPNALSGPDFLEAVAEQEAANGNDVNAHIFRERALQWKALEQQFSRLAAANDDMSSRLQHIAEHATSAPAHSGPLLTALTR